MKATVAICTWNRADLLEKTLAQMQRLNVPDGIQWELLVVNNNCTDNTDEILNRYSTSLPLRRLLEPNAGLSNARNCAIRAAQGELLLWTDDDVLVDPDWLQRYILAFSEFPKATFGGGTIAPWFSISPPKWAESNLDLLQGAFAIRQLGTQLRILDETESVFGANMAFRTSALREIQFDPNLGVVGGQRICGEEVEVINRLRKSGGVGLWVGNAKVKHFIPRERISAAYIRKVAVGYGKAIAHQSPDSSVASLFGRPRWALKKYVQHRAIELACRPFRNRRWLRSLQEAGICSGIIDYHCRQNA